MSEREPRPYYSPRINRFIGSVVMASVAVLTTNACSTRESEDCGGIYEVSYGSESLQQSVLPQTPEGRITLSFNTDDGKLIHVYLAKGDRSKELTDAEIQSGHARFELEKTVLEVGIDESEISIDCADEVN